ncbi:hypothetical protein JD969_09680 [Planctomycetota bacterium]|nr:hypothetical protein JD969_09680 [Planctomycetota bacterium]
MPKYLRIFIIAITLFFLFILAFNLISTQRQFNKLQQNADNAIIKYPGTFKLNNKKYTLNIKLTPDGNGHLVTFTILDSKTQQTLLSDNLGSNFSRWYFYYQEPTLYTYSGDLGLFKFSPDTSPAWSKQTIDTTKANNLPTIYYDNLPNSLK